MIALLDASPGANTSTDRAIIEVIVVLVNFPVLIWPLLRTFLTGTFHGYYEKLVGVYEYLHSKVFVRLCGSKEQKEWIAATAAKEKARAKRKKERRRQAAAAAAADTPCVDAEVVVTETSTPVGEATKEISIVPDLPRGREDWTRDWPSAVKTRRVLAMQPATLQAPNAVSDDERVRAGSHLDAQMDVDEHMRDRHLVLGAMAPPVAEQLTQGRKQAMDTLYDRSSYVDWLKTFDEIRRDHESSVGMRKDAKPS